MKINGEFILRQIADETILVPVGQTALKFNGLITLTPVSSFIWSCLEQDMSREQILEKLLQEYDVDRETAKTDLDEFLTGLRQWNLLISEDSESV